MNKDVNNYDDDLNFGMKDTLEVYCEKNFFNTFRVFLDEPITEPSKYRNVINTLERATENDIVELRLNTPGGNYYTTMALYNAILNCPAHTRAILDGEACSGGSMILLACDEVVVMKNTYMMCHAASWGDWGDMKKLRNSTTFSFEQIRKTLYDVYEGFLTNEEIEQMIEHSLEYWFGDEEIIERLKNRQEYLRKQSEEIEKPVSKPRTRKKKDV